MKKLTLFTCATAVLYMASFVSAADSIKEGKWEFITQTQMEGMPQMPDLPPGVKLPPGINMSKNGNGIQMTVTKCITKNDVVPGNKNDQTNCKITKMDRKGNRVDWSVYCKEKDSEMMGDGMATYNGDTMESKMVMNTRDPKGHSMKQTSTIKGKYLGPCK